MKKYAIRFQMPRFKPSVEYLPDGTRSAARPVERVDKISAVKILRQAANIGLKEAKDIIDAMIGGKPLHVTGDQLAYILFVILNEHPKPYGQTQQMAIIECWPIADSDHLALP